MSYCKSLTIIFKVVSRYKLNGLLKFLNFNSFDLRWEEYHTEIAWQTWAGHQHVHHSQRCHENEPGSNKVRGCPRYKSQQYPTRKANKVWEVLRGIERSRVQHSYDIVQRLDQYGSMINVRISLTSVKSWWDPLKLGEVWNQNLGKAETCCAAACWDSRPDEQRGKQQVVFSNFPHHIWDTVLTRMLLVEWLYPLSMHNLTHSSSQVSKKIPFNRSVVIESEMLAKCTCQPQVTRGWTESTSSSSQQSEAAKL